MSSATVKSLHLLLLLVSLLAVFAAPARADDPGEEIIYRVNLGRAADVKLLLAHGAQANETDDNGVPLLCLAAQRRDAEGPYVVAVLIQGGADINAKDDNGQTALFYAARVGNTDVVKYLLVKGINYYATDNRGDIARTIAFRAGHQNIVALLDDFVKAQTAKTEEAYKEYNKTVEERYKQQQAQEQQVLQEAAKAASTPAPTSTPTSAGTPTPTSATAADARQREATIKKLAGDLSYTNCAFEYWYFVTSTHQTTEMGADELALAVSSNKDKILALEKQLIHDYNQPAEFVSKLSDTAKATIFNQLQSMGSNSARYESGVGHMDDMETRCKAVAQQWDIENVAVEPTDNGNTSGGGIGAVSKTVSAPSQNANTNSTTGAAASSSSTSKPAFKGKMKKSLPKLQPQPR